MRGGGGWGPEGPAHGPQGSSHRHQVLTSLHLFFVVVLLLFLSEYNYFMFFQIGNTYTWLKTQRHQKLYSDK